MISLGYQVQDISVFRDLTRNPKSVQSHPGLRYVNRALKGLRSQDWAINDTQ